MPPRPHILVSAALTLGTLLTAGCASAGASAGRHIEATRTGIVRADAHIAAGMAATADARTAAERIEADAARLLSSK